MRRRPFARRSLLSLIALSIIAGLVGLPHVSAGPPVAPTEALPPDEQRTHFKLPPGFEIQLVASEPQIQKPMNLAFDARGRLWVTHSVEYPFAAADPAQARDGITILSDFGPDGRARKAERFAEGLNIPIGVLPLGDGHEAIVWSIPNIWKLFDEDRDGKADRREILYGPFDIADTHGNQNAFRLMPDGWVYACHGFRNDSKVKLRGEGPVVMQLQSGNTYRFRPDGSAIEQVTWGQVNPFGMCFDRWGDAYTADCHSKPITHLVRGGYYESFGKPHDGLGFAPPMTAHDHDSTGIAGVAVYDAAQYPAEYRDCFYVGNVITNVVHRDVPQWRGSSPWISAPVDFVSCSDPWFHPVDIQLGPDGALYLADFYNSIIGHYEVDLKHPRRDRTRGRLWRVVWKGDAANGPPPSVIDFTTLSKPQLVERLSDPNLQNRLRATLQLQTRGDDATLAAALALPADSLGAAQAVWLAHHAGRTPQRIAAEATHASAALTRVQLLAAAGELSAWDEPTRRWVLSQLRDESPFVRRHAAATLAKHPHGSHVAALLQAFAEAPEQDVQLVHTLKLALRNQFRDPGGLAELAASADRLAPERALFVIDLVLATASGEAAEWAFRFLRDHRPDAPQLERSVQQVARYGAPTSLVEVVEFASTKLRGDANRSAGFLRAILEGQRQRGAVIAADQPVGRWIESQTAMLLDPSRHPVPAWSNQPLEVPVGGKVSPSPWGVRTRRCEDGLEIPVFDSIVGGESLTGVLRSAPFAIPDTLTFWLCGHNGLPGTTPPPVNHIRLRLSGPSSGSSEVIAQQVAPRNDVAQKTTWDLSRWRGQQAVLEVVDADAGAAYAWIGVGRFEPPVVASPTAGLPTHQSPYELAFQAIDQVFLKSQLPATIKLVDDGSIPAVTRAAALQTVYNLDPAAAAPRMTKVLAAGGEPPVLRSKAAELLAATNTVESRKAVAETLATAPAALQPLLALALASRKEGAESLLTTIGAGKASPRLLQEKPLVDRLKASGVERLEERIETLTAGLPAPEERVRKLQSERLAAWTKVRGDVERGKLVFRKHCVACHRVSGEGAMVGPQLDGIGNRGAERLLEDVFDPNRNVDAAFRTTLITREDGQIVTGLKLRQEGDEIVLANAEGKEVRVATKDVEESRLSALSLMPGNFADALPPADVADLLEFLVSLVGREPKP